MDIGKYSDEGTNLSCKEIEGPCPFINLILQDRYLIKNRCQLFLSNKYFKACDQKDKNRHVIIKINANRYQSMSEFKILQNLN